jgi:hypothetical protein
MQSTLSLTLDLTQKKGFFTDTTDYSAISVDLNALGATGSVAIYFQGDSIGSPLTIDLAGGDTTTPLFDLELDLNGDVANGSYSAVYTVDFDFSNTTALATPNQIVFASIGENYQGFTAGAEIEVSVDLPGGASIVSAEDISGNLYVTIDESVSATFPSLRTVNVTQTFSGFSWVYSGCTQVSADVNFVYDCEYGDSGTWSVANTTALGSNEIVSSLSCVVSYPSWTAVDQSFNPQVVITSLPYPTTPSLTPLATGTYTVSLSQQIQQNQASGLVVVYNNSVIKEFAVTCAGTLCGLVPCIENLRAAHATELTRNRISKYQVFVDNVLLYYTEAMNYRSCGELDKYKETIALLQAQLDASGCECACCDDETYYWVSNNSATSVIEELLANFQYRLFDGAGSDPGPSQAGVEYGAIWQDVSDGILYRCIDATPTSLDWEVYYDPSDIVNASEVVATATAPLTALNVQGQLDEIATNAIFGATNGLTESGDNVKLGGTLTESTTIDVGANFLSYPITSGFISLVKSTSGFPALVVSGVDNTFAAQSTDDLAGVFAVNRTATDNTVAKNVKVQTGTSGTVGNGFGASVEFALENTSGLSVTTSSIKSSWENAASQNSKLELTTANNGVESTFFTLNSVGATKLSSYGTGAFTGTPTHSLSVDSSGNVIETTLVPKLFVAKITSPSLGVYNFTEMVNTTGGTISMTYNGTAYTIVSSNSAFTVDKTFITATLEINTPAIFTAFHTSASQILANTQTTTSTELNGLPNALIKIEIYP